MEKLIYVFALAFVCTSAVPVDDSSSGSGRISNGLLAAQGEFPYVVSLQRTRDIVNIETRGHVCGGVLFTFQRALTAAHCTYVYAPNSTLLVPIVASDYRVFAGGNILSSDASPNVTRPIANYTTHPQYSGAPAFFNDIAIITLTAPFPASAVTPLPLPSTNFRPADHTSCTVAGWGALQYGTIMPSPQLMYMNKYIYNQNICANLYNPLFGSMNILSTMVCAASPDIVSTGCFGDEGNALVCGGTLTGISFWTDGCMQSSWPEVYTRVSNYTTWIRTVTGSASSFEPATITLVLFTIAHAVFQKMLAA